MKSRAKYVLLLYVYTYHNEQWTIKTMAIDLILKQVNDIKSMWEELIKDASAQQHRGAVRINRDTASHK